MAEVQADARARRVQVPFQQIHQGRGVRQRVRDHLERDPDPDRLREPADLLDAAKRRGAVVLAPLRRRRPEMDDEDVRRNLPRDVQRGVRFTHRRLPRRAVAHGVRERLAPVIRGREAFRYGRMNAVERQPRLLQPLRQPRNRRRVVIVEVAPGREHLHGLESVRRNLRQVFPAQPLVVVQVRGDTKAHGAAELTERKPVILPPPRRNTETPPQTNTDQPAIDQHRPTQIKAG